MCLPRLGRLRLKERGYFPVHAKVTRATVSERAGRWFVAIQTKEKPKRRKGTEILGVDVGITPVAVVSDGTVFERPQTLRVGRRRLQQLARSVGRKAKGSRNRQRAVVKLARQHYRVSCIRNDMIHKMTNAITKRASVLGIETLNVAGMLKNRCLAKALSDAALGEILRQLKYKMQWSGGTIVQAGVFYPSSKTCSACGCVLDVLPLSVREWNCPNCGVYHDRNQNAAVNLRNVAASLAVTACGVASSGSRSSGTKLATMKQEPNTIPNNR